MNKAEIFNRLRELTEVDYNADVKEEVNKISEIYREVMEQEYHESQLDKLEGKETDEEKKEEIKKSKELNQSFKELVNLFREKDKEWREKKNQILKEKLEKKAELIDRLKFINETDEYLPIKEKYEHFNEIKKEWDALGHLFSEAYRNLKNRFNQELQVFYHKIEIDKELRDMDFEKNQQARLSIIDKVRTLKEESQIWKADAFLKMYRQEWEDAGRVKNEDFEKLKNDFFEAYKEVSAIIKQFYDEKDAKVAEITQLKQQLIDKMKEVNTQLPNKIKEWNKKSDEVNEIIQEWRKSGFISRKKNQDIWENFSKELDVFFQHKRAFFKDLKDKRKSIRAEKEKLIEKISAYVKDPGDWQQSTEDVKQIQQKWKTLGRLRAKEEDLLWSKLRELSDKFFEYKKQYFESLLEQKSEATKERKAWLNEISKLSLSGDKEKDLEKLSELQEKWGSFEKVEPASEKGLNGQFRKIMDGFYKDLKIDEKERVLLSFRHKIERLKQDERALELIDNEKRFVKNKLKEAEATLAKLEDSMALFTGFSGKGAKDSPLLKEAQKKVETAGKEKAIWEEKWTLLKPIQVKKPETTATKDEADQK